MLSWAYFKTVNINVTLSVNCSKLFNFHALECAVGSNVGNTPPMEPLTIPQ